MKKIIFSFSIIMITIFCLGQTFSDVAEDRWSYDYINRLVEMGITDGYPDGTFRPESTINREEIVAFLIKLNDVLVAKQAAENIDKAYIDKLLNETRAELNTLQYQLNIVQETLKKERQDPFKWQVAGAISARGIQENLSSKQLSSKKGSAYQKAEVYVQKKINNYSKIYMAYDTDYMQFDGKQDLPINQALSLKAEIDFKAGDLPLNLAISSGAGNTENVLGDAVKALKDETKLSAKIFGIDKSLSYIQMPLETSLIQVDFNKNFKKLPVLNDLEFNIGALNYYSSSSNFKGDTHIYLNLQNQIMPKINLGFGLIVRKEFLPQYIGFDCSFVIDDLLGTKTVVKGSYFSYGNKYFFTDLDEYPYLKTNVFDNWVGINDSAIEGFLANDLALIIEQELTSKLILSLGFNSAMTYGGKETIFNAYKIGLLYKIYDNVDLSFEYQNTNYQKGSIADKLETDSLEAFAVIRF